MWLFLRFGHYPALSGFPPQILRYWPITSTGEEHLGFQRRTNTLLGRIYEALVQAWSLTEEAAAEVFASARNAEDLVIKTRCSEGKRLTGTFKRSSDHDQPMRREYD